jgi:hypothetical protein
MIRSCQVDHLNWKEFSDRVAHNLLALARQSRVAFNKVNAFEEIKTGDGAPGA